jgi:hypothetical protein
MSDVTLMSEKPETLGSPRDRAGGATFGEAVGRRSGLAALADPASHLPTYAGVAVAMIGFAMIGVGWAKVAGLVDVWRQMPYLLSAGLPGLGLVMTGLVVINVSARRQDAAARARQTATLTEALRDLQRTLNQ